MRSGTSIASHDAPSVIDGANLMGACREHGLDGNDHAPFETHARANLPIVGDKRRLVHAAPDTVPRIVTHDAKTRQTGDLLDGMPDVPR